jgi:hypothetical protein
MSLIQGFIEGQAKKFLSELRVKLDKWLTENDLDGDGLKDKEQALADFDRISAGVRAAINLAGLLAAYWSKFGPKQLAEAPDDQESQTV